MTESVAPEFARFIADQRKARRLVSFPSSSAEGQAFPGISVDAAHATELIRVAARRAVGLFRPSKHTEVVWFEGGAELAVGFAELSVKLSTGLIELAVPVRCDQTGRGLIRIWFAVGSPAAPAGLYAATCRRPHGPPTVVDTWGDSLVAFGWHCLLELVSGIAGATGKDQRGNLLVPVELSASARALEIVPMSRYRFAGSSGLKSPGAKR